MEAIFFSSTGAGALAGAGCLGAGAMGFWGAGFWASWAARLASFKAVAWAMEGTTCSFFIKSTTLFCSWGLRKDSSTAVLKGSFLSSTCCFNSGTRELMRTRRLTWLRLIPMSSATIWSVRFWGWASCSSLERRPAFRARASIFILAARASSEVGMSWRWRLPSTTSMRAVSSSSWTMTTGTGYPSCLAMSCRRWPESSSRPPPSLGRALTGSLMPVALMDSNRSL